MSKKIKNALNEKLQTKLPQSLEKESIIQLIDDEKFENTDLDIDAFSIQKKKNKVTRLIPVAASLALVIGLLSIFGDIDSNKKITTTEDISEVCRYQSYDKIYEKFDKLHKSIKKDNIFNLYGVTEEAYNTSADTMTGSAAAGGFSDDADIALPESSVETGRDFGTTNTQEAGVDEGDVIKTDGRYLFVANRQEGTVSVIDTVNDSLQVLSKMELEKNYCVEELYLSGNNLIIIGNSYQNENNEGYTSDMIYGCGVFGFSDSFVKVFDITKPEAPTLVTEYSQQGSYNSSRMINGMLYCISTYYVNIASENYRDYCVPETTINGVCQKLSAEKISVVEDSQASSYIIITTLNTTQKGEPESEAVLGNGTELYASLKGLFVSERAFEDGQEYTKLYRFEYTDTGVNYKCMGKVPGYINDQFSMSYDGEYFRVATTVIKTEKKGESFSMSFDGRVNNLYILNSQMQKVGCVEDLAKGESIQSARFIGDMAYVVTFRQTDPLFVIDLSDPENPTVKGELKITGFSEYLHPIAENVLIGVGQDGTEDGINGDCKVSVFDVSDPLRPFEASKLTVSNGNGTVYTPVANNHKAFVKLPENEFMVPFSVNKFVNSYYTQYCYYIRYSLQGTELKEVARCPLAENCDVLVGTYIDSNFYALIFDYKKNESQIIRIDLETNQEAGKVKV